MQENNYEVYKHIFPNGKVYIGIAKDSAYQRWGKNGYGYRTQFVYKAIKKYGWENIKHVIIAKNLSQEDAKNAERKLIKRYKSNDLAYGYNRTAGGDHKASGYNLSEEEKLKKSLSEWSEGLKKEIDCYDLEGNYIKTFHGYREAMKETGVAKSNIIQSIQGKIGRAKEYMFKIHEESSGENIKPYKEPQPLNTKKVNQYTLNGEYIQTFVSASEAGRELGILSVGISNCCLKKCNSSNGYIWRFYNENENTNNIQTTLIKHKFPKIVSQYDSNENYLQTYKSIKDAAKQTGINYSTIKQYLDGTRKNGGGFIWRNEGNKYVSK